MILYAITVQRAMEQALIELEASQALPQTQAERVRAKERYVREGNHQSFESKFDAMPHTTVTQY